MNRKEAIENFKLFLTQHYEINPTQEIELLIKDAELLDKVEAVMPTRKDDKPYDVGGGFIKINKEHLGFNSCLDLCINAMAKIISEVKTLDELKERMGIE